MHTYRPEGMCANHKGTLYNWYVPCMLIAHGRLITHPNARQTTKFIIYTNLWNSIVEWQNPCCDYVNMGHICNVAWVAAFIRDVKMLDTSVRMGLQYYTPSYSRSYNNIMISTFNFSIQDSFNNSCMTLHRCMMST